MKTVIVDSDALIALLNKDDLLAGKAVKTLEGLYKLEAKLLYPATTLVETTTILQRRLSDASFTKKIIKMINESQFPVVAVDQETIKMAELLFNPNSSKQSTFFDAVVATIAKQQKADAVFSFDDWYEKVGLTLAYKIVDS